MVYMNRNATRGTGEFVVAALADRIVDQPRPTARAAIETAKSAGIQVRMITGDHAVTAAAIASQLGIEGRAITGAEFSALSTRSRAARSTGSA